MCGDTGIVAGRSLRINTTEPKVLISASAPNAVLQLKLPDRLVERERSDLVGHMTSRLITSVTRFLFGKKGSTESAGALYAGYGIPATEEQIELERQSNEEVMKLLEAKIVASGLFRAEKIPELIAILKEGVVPFGRVNTPVVFEGDMILTVKEKKALGLNTRMKYSREFIEYFEPSLLRSIEPKSILESMHLDAFHRVSRKKELHRFRELGFVKEVRIVPVGDERDCRKIKRFKKTWRIEEVPELPLPGCDAAYCRCMYEATISRDL